jgi:hypothetical protein
VESQTHLVEKDDFLKRVWPDSFVEEVALAHCISHLRKALRDGTHGCRFIETVPKRGYRFVAAVEVVPALSHEPSDPVRLAVLPFENLSAGSEREYLADGYGQATSFLPYDCKEERVRAPARDGKCLSWVCMVLGQFIETGPRYTSRHTITLPMMYFQ